MNREDQKTENNDRKMEELRRLLRRLDRAQVGSSVAVVPPNATNDGLVAKPPQPPPLPPLPSLPPRWPSESVTSESAMAVSSEPPSRRLRPHLVVAIAIAAVACVGLVLSIDLPRRGAPTLPYSAGQDVIAGKENAEPGLIAATGTVPAKEAPASVTQDVQAFVQPSAELQSTTPSAAPPAPTATVPVPAAADEPAPKPAEVEPRTAGLFATIPEQTAPASSPSKSGSDATPLLAIPPSFIIEAGVASRFPLRLTRDRWALDGGYLIVSGLLRGSRFSSGTEILFDTWQIPVGALGDLELTIPGDGEATLAIELRSAQGQTVARTTAVLQGVMPAGTAQSR